MDDVNFDFDDWFREVSSALDTNDISYTLEFDATCEFFTLIVNGETIFLADDPWWYVDIKWHQFCRRNGICPF